MEDPEISLFPLLLAWPTLEEVETFPLRNTLHDVHQDDIGEFLVGNAQRAIRADVSGAHNGDFLSQGWLLLRR